MHGQVGGKLFVKLNMDLIARSFGMIFKVTNRFRANSDSKSKSNKMKKLLLIFSVISLSALCSRAQETNFGLKAGYNSSSVKITNGTDYDTKSGFHLGGLAHIHISKYFAVQPELVFSAQGGERPGSKLQLNYLNLPVALQFMIGDGFRLQSGPQLGFLVAAESKFGDVEVKVDDIYSTVDFSWLFGAGYVFDSGLGIDARYNLGINNISDDSDFEARNRVFQVGLFYQFRNNNAKKK